MYLLCCAVWHSCIPHSTPTPKSNSILTSSLKSGVATFPPMLLPSLTVQSLPPAATSNQDLSMCPIPSGIVIFIHNSSQLQWKWPRDSRLWVPNCTLQPTFWVCHCGCATEEEKIWQALIMSVKRQKIVSPDYLAVPIEGKSIRYQLTCSINPR